MNQTSQVSGKRCFVYVLWSVSASSFYIGMGEDAEKRLVQYNSGITNWTARYAPWELVLVESYPSYTDVRKRELLLKKQKGGVGFYALTGLDPARFRNK